ncbi:MAG: UDP-N-acetylmuramate dehydrogenase [Cyclobacteriaceae bacterium]|nr:UDP-N-acetylmuramate dehydrogenase [Cyclobacteriaceae bacterium]
MNIQEQVDLLPYNTFKISARSKYFVAIKSIQEFQNLLRSSVYKSEKHFILGSGSNILLTGDFDGLVIKVEIKGVQIEKEDNESVTIKVGSGEVWHDLVKQCVENGWGGIENLSLIPGTVGAAPMQNIGAYGVEIKEVVKTVEGIDLETGEVRTFSNSECKFGYRESIFKNELREKIFISSVTLTLSKKNHQLRTEYGAIKTMLDEMSILQPTIKSISEAVIKIRQQKLPDPVVLGNSGSFFKNPSITSSHHENLINNYGQIPGYPIENQHVKVPAGWLIEQCGWKGKKIKDAGVHKHQALVLVNYGSASGKEILDLSEKIQADVYGKFKIRLTPEVNII